jgi:hypothetical protein
MAISFESHIRHHHNRPSIQQRGGKQQSSSANPINQGHGQDLFVNSRDSGFHDFNAAKTLGQRLQELGRQQRAGGNSAMFGQQVGEDKVHVRGEAPLPTPVPINDPAFLNNNNREMQGLESVILARSFVTNPPTRIDKLVGKVPNLKDLSWCKDCTYKGSPNTNNMCANFATAILTTTQGLKMQDSAVDYISIPRIRPALKAQGWHSVSRDKAMPGDVWLSDSHIEIISTKGGTHSIGSNTDPQRGYQYVTERPRSGGTILTRRTIR